MKNSKVMNACKSVISFVFILIISSCSNEETHPKINANFNGTETSILVGETVAFTDLSTVNPIIWLWNFDGGNPQESSVRNPRVTYEDPGKYSVTLVASNAGNSDVEIKKDFIQVFSNVIASFMLADSLIILDSEVIFTDNSKGDPTNWNWEFKGGTPISSTDQNPTVTYQEKGVYKILLTVSNTLTTDSTSGFIHVIPEVKASFKMADSTVLVDSEVVFTDNSEGDPANWLWEFEGGTPTSSTEQNPVVTYSVPGDYHITLNTSNAVSSDSMTKVIQVWPRVSASFSITDPVVLVDSEVTFTDNSEGEPTDWNWEIDGGTPGTSTEQNPLAIFSVPGVHEIKLTISNKLSSDSTSAFIEVLSPVVASFTIPDSDIIQGSEVTFIDNSEGDPSRWLWDFEGGTPVSSTVQIPTASFSEPGAYEITLTASNAVSSDVLTKVIQVWPRVSASFSIADSVVNQGSDVFFTENSGGEPTNWLWEFEGGTPISSTEQNPAVTYSEPGVYSVTLTASNAHHEDILTKNVIILPTDGLIVHYPFNGSPDDVSGNANHGVISGATLSPDRYGIDQECYNFDGIDNEIAFGYDANFQNLPISFSFWINFKELNSAVLGNDIIDNIESGVWFSIGQGPGVEGKIAFSYGNGGAPLPTSRKTFVSDEPIITDTWYHIIGIIEDLNTIRIIINGNETAGVYTGSANSFSHSLNDSSIGRVWDPNSFFSGKIDDFRIFNRVITQNEIKALAAE